MFSNKIHKKPISVKFFLITLFLFVFLLFALIFSSIVLYNNYKSLYKQNVQKGSNYAESLATFSLEYYLNLDFATLEKVYYRLFSDESIQEISLLEKGTCLLRLTRKHEGIKIDYAIPCQRDFDKPPSLFMEDKEELIFYAPLTVDAETLAWIKIVINKRDLTSLLLSLVKVSFFIFVLSIILSISLLLFLLRIPLRNLSALENFARSLPEKFGNTISIICLFKELKTLEEALNYASLKLKEFANSIETEKDKLLVTLLSIGDAVIVTNEKGEVILMNKIAEDLTGYTFEEVKGKKVREFLKLVSEQTGKPLEDPISAVLVDGKRRELANHTLLVKRDGEKLFIEDSASPIFSKEGGLLGVVFVFRDVTEKVKTQRELMRLEKMSLVNRLAGGIAHDLNNLLSGMLNYIYLAYFNKSQIEKVIEALSKVENLIAQASSLTRSLLDLSKGAPLVSEVIDLKTFLSEIANFVFTGTPIIVYLDIPEDVMNLKGDPAQFLEIFQNLFINARDVLGSGGRVEIKAENAEEFIKISISDNGPGIPEEILPHIFEPFFTTKEGGTGLGLFIVKNIVENYGGKIEVYSEKGRGTTFVLYLPGTQEEVKKEERELPDLFKVARNIKVLIVDDEPEIRTSLKEILEYFGFSVETAENGDRALEIFKNSLEKESPYNLIITDFTMPGSLSGPELAKAIKEIKKDTKIIGTSGYIKSQDELREMYTFFEAILPKPYNLYTLKETLLKVLSS